MNFLKKLFLPIAIFLTSIVSGQQTLGLNAQKNYEITPADYGLVFDTIRIITDDDASLFGWHLYPGEKNDKSFKKSVIISHDGNKNMAEGLEQAGKFLGLGFHVFMYDYRGFGKSSDFNVSSKFFIYQQFATDLNAVIEYVKKYHALLSVDLYGWGIGGGLSLGVGANNLKVHRVIADNPYSTFETVQNRYEQKSGQRIMMPIGYNVTLLEPKMALEDKGDHLRAILLIIGEQGNIMTFNDMVELQTLKKKVTTIYTVKGVDNDKNFSSNRDEYFKQIKAFYEKSED
ncbi:MAG: alpha/beta hydrolase [Chitinophagales bacterium]